MKDVIKKMFPDLAEREEIVFKNTGNPERYFHVDWNTEPLTMYVPHIAAVRGAYGLLDQLIDHVRGFDAQRSLGRVDWSNVQYIDDDQDEALAIQLINNIPEGIELGCDIETRHIALRDNKVLAIGIAPNRSRCYIITCFTPAVIQALTDLADPARENSFIWHNGKFDTVRLKKLLGLDWPIHGDTMLRHYATVSAKRGTHGLKDLGSLYCGAPAWEDELDQIKKEYARRNKCRLEDFTYDMFPRDKLLRYLSYDCCVTLDLYHKLQAVQRDGSAWIYSKLIKAANVYKELELNGVMVDQDYLEDLAADLDKQLWNANKVLDKEINLVWDPILYQRESGARTTPKFFNIKSPKQLKWVIERSIGRAIKGTSKEILAEIFEDYEDRGFINALQTVRKLNKYMDTYVTGILDAVDVNWRVHCTYNLHGTETGRLSSSDPNMQNIPRNALIKNLFIPSRGCRFLQLDYSQAELRVLAYLSRDPFLAGIYQRDEDLHDAVATKLFGPGFTKEQRVSAKTVNFGIAYGLGPPNLAAKQKIPMSEAQAIIDGWLNNAVGADKWIKEQRRKVFKGIPATTEFGRERSFVVTNDNLNHVQNEYVNTPIQSLASDLTMLSLLEIDNWIKLWGLEDRARIVITVHDSIVLEIEDNDELAQTVARACVTIMSELPKKLLKNLEIPFKADAEQGYKWGELKPIEFDV